MDNYAIKGELAFSVISVSVKQTIKRIFIFEISKRYASRLFYFSHYKNTFYAPDAF
jgi:hypothetical protein